MRSIKKTPSSVPLVLLVTMLALQFGCSRQSGNQNGSPNSDPSIAQKYYGRIKAQGDTLNQASIRGDNATATDLTHPALVQFVGGREQYMAMLQDTRAEMLAEQVQIISANVEQPTQVIEAGNEIYVVVPVTWRMKAPEGVLVGRSYMIAVSADRGANWKFVSAAGEQLEPEQLKQLFPAAADKLQIPQTERPVLEQAAASPTP